MNNEIIFQNYHNIFNLCRNCSASQIITYLENYENTEELENILKIEDIFGNTPTNILFKNININIDLFIYLTNNYEIFNIHNKYKLYPLNYAIEYLDNDKKNIIKLLIDNITNLNIIDINDNTIYHNLVIINKDFSLNFFKYIYYKYKLDTYDNKNTIGYTPLLYSCDKNNNELTKFLLSIDCDHNIINNNHNTCLMYTCMNNNLEMIKLLIDKDIDINIKDKQDDNALSYLCGCDIKDNCSLDNIKFLIEKGADYNNINKENNTLLIYATGSFSQFPNFKIDIDIIKYLIELGIDINIKNNNNKICLDYIAIKDINILQELLNENTINISNNLKLKYYYLFNLEINKEYILNITDNSVESCIICFEDFNNDDELLKCHNNHIYHSRCLTKWFNSNNYNICCPTCKDEFKFSDKIIKYL